MKIWGQGESKLVFSKVHLDIFKRDMQWLFMFHSLLSLTWPDNFFQADLLPKVPEVIWASAKSSSPSAPINSKSWWKALHTISAQELKRFQGLPAGWWQYSPDQSCEHMTSSFTQSSGKMLNFYQLQCYLLSYEYLSSWSAQCMCGCVHTCLIW